MRATDVLTVPRIEPWLGREMASEQRVERLFLGSRTFPEQQHPSEILRTRSERLHRLGQLYDEMIEKDSDLAAFALKRSEAVLKLPRLIVPADSTPQALEVADFCHRALGIVSGFASNLAHQLGSRARGIAIEELVWERLSRGPLTGAWVPVAMKDRPMWRFAFLDDRLHVRQALGDPIPAPPGKFLVMTHGTKDNPWGRGLLDNVYWYWFIKRHGWKFYAVFIEKWAQPTATVKYPHRNRALAAGGEDVQRSPQDLQAKALEIAHAIQSDYSIAIPEGILIELLEAKRSGDGSYNQFLAACTRGEALVFLGEINTSGLRPGTGAYASEEVSNSIRYEKVELDAKDLGSHLRDNLLKPLVQLNFGPDAPVPDFLILHVDAQDREQRRKGIERALEDGQPVPRRYYYLTLQIPEPREGEEVVLAPKPAPPVAAPPPPPPSPAAGGEDDGADEGDEARGGREPEGDQEREAPAVTASAKPQTIITLADETTADLLAEAEARDAAMAEIAAAFRSHTLDHYQRQQELVLEAWDDGRFEAGDALRWVADRLDPAAHAQRIQAAQVHGAGLAFSHLLADGIDARHWVLPGGRQPGPVAFSARPLPPYQQLLAAPAGFAGQDTPQTATDWWSRLLDIPKSHFTQLSDEQRRYAFTVAGVTDAELLLEVHQLGQRAALEGWKRDRFREELAAAYRRHGVEPTSDWHADLIYTNNVRQANGAVRYQQTVGNPAAHRLIPYLGWATLGDDRVRARPQHNHQVMADKVFAIGHEIWLVWWYPAGHNCRCYVYTISRAKAERMGLVGAEPTGPWPVADVGRALPDPGFRGAPSLGTAAADVMPRLFDLVDEARRTNSPDLLGALRQILSALGLLAAVADLLGGIFDGGAAA